MPRPTKGPRLGGSAQHERHILANLATQLFIHEQITTTEARARRLRPYVEKLITKGKRGDLHTRRTVLKKVTDKFAVYRLFEEIAPKMADRPGGYTRIIKTGFRANDNAPMCFIELVDFDENMAKTQKKAKRARRSKKSTDAPVAEVAETATEAPAETAAE